MKQEINTNGTTVKSDVGCNLTLPDKKLLKLNYENWDKP
jgi:hypothetical protein